MTLTTTTHLNFHGAARDALEFYRTVFGGELSIATYADFGMPADLPGATNVVFGELTAPNGFHVMAYDIPGAVNAAAPAASTRRENGTTITTQPFFVSVRASDLGELTGYWSSLGAGATLIEELAASAWSAGFGMLADRFGVVWVLDVASAPAV